MDLTDDQLRALARYEGWVAWVGQNPIFEAIPPNSDLAPLDKSLPGAGSRGIRHRDRRHVEWDDLPHEKVTRLELYFARDTFPDQPVVRLDRLDEPIRWVQMKMRGLQVDAAAVDPRAGGEGSSPKRTPVQGYRLGYFAPGRLDMPDGVGWQYAPLLYIEVMRSGEIERYAHDLHPCWPRPHGLGWNPAVLGIEPSDVPPVPGPVEDGTPRG